MTWLRRAAGVISVVGHPLISTTAFLCFIAARYSTAVPFYQVAIIVVCVVLPLTVWNLRRTRAGTYSNFDVSVRAQRTSMYWVLLGLTAIATVLLWRVPADMHMRLGMTCMLGVVVVSSVANQWIKVSLHAATSFFLSLAGWLVDKRLGAAFFVCSILVAASRLVLRRHTVSEIVLGTTIGLAAGAAFLWLG